MTDERLGVVVVGTGFGCRIHVPAARAAGFDVVALVGRDPEKTARRAARAEVEVSCGSLAEALALPHADVVVVSTDPASHAPLAEEAIAAGRHVLVEKPFTLDASEARGLLQAADRAGVVALVGHEFRFVPQRVTVRQALADGAIGAPRLGTFVGHLPLVAAVDAPAPRWWFDPAGGGGWLGAAVSHLVDAIRSWLGELDSVSAALPMVSDRDAGTMAEDSVSLRFRTRSGCEGVIQQSAAVWGERIEVMRIAGPRGTLTLDGEVVHFADADGTRTLDLVGPPLPVDISPSDDPRHRFTHIELGPATVQARVLRDLARGVTPEYDLVPPATFVDGVACMEVLDAVRRSAADAGATTAVG
ncbi:MAG TPA: Gfo/Idh/MocA family oxidoreductase [Acidimicrobiia bacterium]|jgi:predicted dehydrogenase